MEQESNEFKSYKDCIKKYEELGKKDPKSLLYAFFVDDGVEPNQVSYISITFAFVICDFLLPLNLLFIISLLDQSIRKFCRIKYLEGSENQEKRQALQRQLNELSPEYRYNEWVEKEQERMKQYAETSREDYEQYLKEQYKDLKAEVVGTVGPAEELQFKYTNKELVQEWKNIIQETETCIADGGNIPVSLKFNALA